MKFDINKYEIIDYSEKEFFYSPEGDLLNKDVVKDNTTIMWRAQFYAADIIVESDEDGTSVRIIDNEGDLFRFTRLNVSKENEDTHIIYEDDVFYVEDCQCRRDTEYTISEEDTKKLVEFLRSVIVPRLNDYNNRLPIHQTKEMCGLIKEIGDYFEKLFDKYGIDVNFPEEEDDE